MPTGLGGYIFFFSCTDCEVKSSFSRDTYFCRELGAFVGRWEHYSTEIWVIRRISNAHLSSCQKHNWFITFEVLKAKGDDEPMRVKQNVCAFWGKIQKMESVYQDQRSVWQQQYLKEGTRSPRLLFRWTKQNILESNNEKTFMCLTKYLN